MLSKQAQFPIPSYLSKSLETLCDLRVMLSHGQGLELGLKIYGKVGTTRSLRTVRQQSVKFGQAGAC
jgi:hypothetical protein